MALHDPEPLFDESTIATKLCCKVKTLQVWRCRGGGPPFYKIGRLVRYRLSEVEAFIDSRRVHSTSQK